MKPVMRYHGGKFRIASWIMSFFPPHRTYVEPFGGAAGVLMQKPRCYAEVYNDLDQQVVTVFRVLQDPELSKQLQAKLAVTPYSRDEFLLAYEESADPVETARRVLIRSYMGFGSAGATKHRTGFRIDTAREYGTSASLWPKLPAEIDLFCQRLAGVVIENRPAIEVIQNHDRKDTLFYVDPPYVLSTRVMGSNRHYYNHEMTDEEHEHLLQTLLTVRGMVVLSGYDNELYRAMLPDWQLHQVKARISAGRGTTTRTECLWLNPRCAGAQPQLQIFDQLETSA